MPSATLPKSAETDCDLCEQVKAVLHERGDGPLKPLEINVMQGIVLVQGRVPTFYLRQIAVESIKRVAGVTQVVDLIEVAAAPRQSLQNDNSNGEPEIAIVSTRLPADIPEMVGTIKDATRSHFRRRHLHLSAQ